MLPININPETAVPLIVGVGSTLLAVLLMLIKIPKSQHSDKLANSKRAIIISLLICSFVMFYAMSQYAKPEIGDWDMFLMLSIYIVVHFSTTIITHSMVALLREDELKFDRFYMPGMVITALLAFLLLESYESADMAYFQTVVIITLSSFLIQFVFYVIYFDKAYKKSLQELENYYDEDTSHRIKWVRFCYIIAMLTNVFVLVYLLFYWFLDYKLAIASIYSIWYLLYMLYLTSNFISFLGSHKLVLDAFARQTLSGQDIINMINENKKRRGDKTKSSLTSINEKEFRKLEENLKIWIEEKRFTQYDKSRDDIARELNTSKEVLHHYFATKKGVDFKTWRTQLRVEEAKRLLLANKEVSSNVIAEVVGFSDRSNFHRQFVKIVGCSPRQWRESDGTFTPEE